MSDQTNRILNEIFEDERFIEVHTLYSKSFEEWIQQNEKSRQRDVDKNKNSTI